MLNIDFETRSEVDLKVHGVYRYAQDPSTGVYMMAYAFDDDPVQIWTCDKPFPSAVVDYVTKGGIIQAWNAQFERLIWWYVLSPDFNIPEPKLEQFQCTAARARAHALPGALGKCAKILGGAEQKQKEGSRLIREYSKQNVSWDDINAFDKAMFVKYCQQDVEVERHISSMLRELTDHEWYEYHVNEQVCDRGIPIDIHVVKAALDYAEEARSHINDRLLKLTNGAVPTTRSIKARDAWLLPQLSKVVIEELTNPDTGNLKLDKSVRQSLIGSNRISKTVSGYLKLVEDAGGATISKYQAMLNREINGRVHGTLLFNGGGQTGRFSSVGLQMHNLRRDSLDNCDQVIENLLGGYELEDVTSTLSRLVRSTIQSDKGLTWFDFSAIEGRVAPWLADSEDGDKKLRGYADGVDFYVKNAAAYYSIRPEKVTKDQRQLGKVQELALQFLGGVGALQSMASNFGLTIPEHEAKKARDSWREQNPWALTFGNQLEEAIIKAMGEPDAWHKAGRVAYAWDGDNWLWCKLPSGRLIANLAPKLEYEPNQYGDISPRVTCAWGAGNPKAGEPWPRRNLYCGLLLENVTQAVAADLLRESIVRAYEAGLCVVMHVHDEIVIEGGGNLGKLMLQLPKWATGLPLAGEGDKGERYGK